MNNKAALRQIIGWGVMLTTSALFIIALVNNWQNIKQIDFSFNAYSLIAIALFFVAVTQSGVLWGQLVYTLTGKRISRKAAMMVHTSSWLLKYIPGQAGSYINKLTWATNNGFSKKTITVSFIYENIFVLIASLILSIPVIGVIFYDDVSSNLTLFTPLLLTLLALPLLNRRFFYWAANTVFVVLKGQRISEEYFLTNRLILQYCFKFLLPRALTGIAFVFVAASFLHIEPGMWIGLIAIYVLAGIIGLLAVFVPSGLGVREAVITLLASNYFPIETAIALSLVARLYATIADGLLAGFYFYAKSRNDT